MNLKRLNRRSGRNKYSIFTAGVIIDEGSIPKGPDRVQYTISFCTFLPFSVFTTNI